jgi:hypothetical protein
MFLYEISNKTLLHFETQSTGEFTIPDNLVNVHYQELVNHGKHIGKLSNHKTILQTPLHDNTYLIGINVTQGSVNKGPIAFVKFGITTIDNQQYIDIILVHSLSTRVPELAKTQNMIDLFMFMKNHFKLPFIDGTGYQSDKAISLIKWIARTTNTKLKWKDILTGEEQPYNHKVDNPSNEPFRNTIAKTNWRLIAESAGTFDVENYEIHNAYMTMVTRGIRKS